MIQTELYINNERADIAENYPVPLTIQINDLADLKDRQSIYSQTIRLPKTATNKRLLGYADSDSFTQIQPYRKNPAKLVQGGVEVVPYGALTLQAVSDFFECQLTAGLVGINDILSIVETDLGTGQINVRDAKLVDLDFTDIPNFNFDLATVVASQAGTGVLWPVIDYGGTLTTASVIDITYLRPGVYIFDIINRIQKFLGYSFKGSIFSDTQYLTDFVPFSNTILYDYQGTEWRKTSLPISVAKNLPDFTVKEFLKDFMQRYFLTPVVDNYAKTVEFKSFDLLYANKATAKDWTSKFIDDARTDEFALANYAQINYLMWKSDEKYLTNGIGTISVDNTTLPLNNTLVTSIFAASNTAYDVVGGQNVASIHKFPESPLPNQGMPFTIDTEARIVNIRKAKEGIYAFKDIHDQLITTNCRIGLFRDATHSGIGYDNQLEKYGQGLLKLVKKCRVPTRYAVLQPSDVANFDFFTPVYDAKEAKYYYVNSIQNFIPGQKTKLSLIRM